jgi:hypothetical protein
MKKIPALVITMFLMGSVLGCQAIAPTASGAATLPPASNPTSISDTAAAPRYLSLGSATISETGKGPDYALKVSTPVMNGSTDPHVVAFNQAVSQLIQKQVAGFKKSLLDVTPSPASPGSTLDVEYTLVSQSAQIVSLRLNMDQYMAGAAHPLQTSVSFNYDLAKGQEISLDQLFVPGANYLPALSDYCKTALNKTDLGSVLFMDGLSPTADNYRNWNISDQGLVITFDEYQVAPYAAGPQTVTVPYQALKDLIAPQGPLAEFNK